MKILGRSCLLLIFCSVLELYKSNFEYFLECLPMDCANCLNACLKHLSSDCNFGCGVLVFWGFKQVLELLSLFLLFGFGLKVLKFSWSHKGLDRLFSDIYGKSGLLKNKYCTKSDFDRKRISKISSYNEQKLSPVVFDKSEKTEFGDCDANADGRSKNYFNKDCDYDNYDFVEGHEDYDEDDEFDVVALRKLVKIERRRALSASLELEKERMSTATAAEETMAMILRLQNEKSLIEMEANQYRRLAEEKQLHDEEVIQSLQWLVLEHESERTVLEDQLRKCQEKLKLFMQSDEAEKSQKVEEAFSSFKFEDALEPSLFSSLKLDLSPD